MSATITVEEARERWAKWPKQRSRALERDSWMCQECDELVGARDSSLPTAEVHHLIPVRSGGSDDLSNLLTLCESCHTDIESEWACVYPTIGTSYRKLVRDHRTATRPSLSLDDLPEALSNDTDLAIIEELREGRNLPSNVADAVGCTQQHARLRINWLEAHGLVRNIGRGIYEIAENEVPNDA